MLALEELAGLVEAEQVVERVVERAQVGIDLLREVAGQEAQPLAGLDRGTDEHEPLDGVALERVDGAGDGEIGLAGARGADRERDVVLLDVLQVERLVRRAAVQVGAARAQERRCRRPRRRDRARCVVISIRPSWMSSTDSGFSACA